ncbi:LLM class flavin-dependent oxidoreductase [Flavihumibacter stibioxidans]|uniref:Luciferase-like domain-containing protein n=1 Tax=Flavihumibacter stibioxidans TaxID=1834163 RepID=A0ABR7M7Q0_9BACT|nr:LLM class flavin-dependent oxidoreductase [Flavihumibacter stibioxidans]MBC6490750.1 hypothetical protein [Flavihumibacter stibioxidans]
MQNSVPFSILDLAPVLRGKSIAETYQNSLELALHAEKWGYQRYWLAEHHNMESVASAATSVLIGFIAGGTRSIRVGSGGIMLPNHAPLVVAEQFGTLATLYPGRIDLGLGRAPGTDQVTAAALRRDRFGAGMDFPENLHELQTYLSADNKSGRVRALPGEGLEIPLWILGSSTDSAVLAARLGLPYAFASHFAPAYLLPAIRIYRDNFRPSAQLREPYVMAGVNVIAADESAEASRLATSFYQLALGIIRGQTGPVSPPVDSMSGLWTPQEEAAVKHMMHYSFIGNREQVEKGLDGFLAETRADELMVVTYVYDQSARLRSYEILSSLSQSRDPSP